MHKKGVEFINKSYENTVYLWFDFLGLMTNDKYWVIELGST